MSILRFILFPLRSDPTVGPLHKNPHRRIVDGLEIDSWSTETVQNIAMPLTEVMGFLPQSLPDAYETVSLLLDLPTTVLTQVSVRHIVSLTCQ